MNASLYSKRLIILETDTLDLSDELCKKGVLRLTQLKSLNEITTEDTVIYLSLLMIYIYQIRLFFFFIRVPNANKKIASILESISAHINRLTNVSLSNPYLMFIDKAMSWPK